MTSAQAVALAVELGLALPALLDALQRIGCVVCDVELDLGEVPDVYGAALDNRDALARRATSTDRSGADEVLGRRK